MIIMLFIGLNMVTMTMDEYQASKTLESILEFLNTFFIVIFTAECTLKVFALRTYYFKEPWNLFDFVVVILSILGKLLICAVELVCLLMADANDGLVNCRFNVDRNDREVFRIADFAACSPSGQSGTCPAIGERRKRNSHIAVCFSNVFASLVQHLPSAFLSDVHLRHIWHVLLYER